MNINKLSKPIQNCLTNAIDDLGIKESDLGFWEVSDYGIFVLMTERFYKTLNFRRAQPEEFVSKIERGDFPFAGSYPDSRQYVSLLFKHFKKYGLSPCVIDVGGYIGRFSLETALLARNMPEITPIYCFEPGLTGNVIQANLMLNGVDKLVQLRAEAASDASGTADYSYLPDVLISGRICDFPSATKHRTVKTFRLDALLKDIGCNEAAIIKIDTEGHEPNVMAGLGELVNTLPNVCIVEFWPETLKSEVNGVPYANFIEQNYYVLNIRSSLYPSRYEQINNIVKFAENFNYDEGNVDLLFVSKGVPDALILLGELMALGSKGR